MKFLRVAACVLVGAASLLAGAEVGGAIEVGGDGQPSVLERVVLYDDGVRAFGYEVLRLDAAGNTTASGGGLEPDVPDLEPSQLAAKNCDGRVCMNVKGTGITVQGWKTTARQFTFDGCQAPDAYFYSKGPTRTEYTIVDWFPNPGPCVTAPPEAVIRWWAESTDVPAKYQSGTMLATSWDAPFTGFPTVRVRDYYVSIGPIRI